jgi:uncharacterized RDD family membrane protein YckC
MKHRTRSAFFGLSLLILCISPFVGYAQQQASPPSEHVTPSPAAPTKVEAPAKPAVDEAVPAEEQVSTDAEAVSETDDTDHHADAIVSIGHDSRLAAGEKADAVVSVFGSSTSEGEVRETVVSVFGDTRVTGPVGEAAVAVMGNLYIDSKVDGDAVAVLGDLELGPHAQITGQAVIVGGSLKGAGKANVGKGVQQILGGHFGGMQWLRPWLKHCLLLGRPLALEPGLGWAWSLALGFLALYVLFALMFPEGIEKCIRTFQQHPGRTVLASFLALILSPIMFCVLAITVVGLIAFPFLLFVAGLFGKAAILALIGGRITRSFRNETLEHPAISVLIGGAIMLALYLIPFVGFIVYKLFGILALGLVAYTVLLAYRSTTPRPAVASAGLAAGSAAPGAAASATGGFAEPSSSTAGSGPDMAFAGAGPAGAAPGVEPSPRPAQPIITDLTALPRAGFWARMGALFIDFVIVAVAINLVNDSNNLLLLLLATYGAVMWKFKGTTVGGIVLGLKVARLDGRPVDWATSIVRALGCFLSLVIAGLGFLWIVFDDDRQAWHDKIAGTVVVRVPKGVSLI